MDQPKTIFDIVKPLTCEGETFVSNVDRQEFINEQLADRPF